MAQKVRSTLDKYHISEKDFLIRVFNNSLWFSMTFLLRKPTPWADCTPARQGHYSKIHSWLNSLSQAEIESLRGDAKLELDTAVVAVRVQEAIEEHGILKKHLFDFLNLTRTKAYNLIAYPVAWSECPLDTKDMYRKLNEWAMSEEKIQALKKAFNY